MDIDIKTAESLRFLTYGSFGTECFFESESCKRYEKYAYLLEENAINEEDVFTIRDILQAVNVEGENLKDENSKASALENFLLDLFVAKNKGSLTVQFENTDLTEKFSSVFAKYDEEITGFAPVVWFEKENKTYAGFHKYVKAAILLRNKIGERLNANKKFAPKDIKNIKNAIDRTVGMFDPKFAPCNEQKVAVCTGMLNKSLSVITGGPGTGKTTVVFSLVNALKEAENLKPEDIFLLAPTGKASLRIKEQVVSQAEKTGADISFYEKTESSTMHSFLGDISLKKKNIKRNYKLVIVDEVSMVDIYLMACLFENLDAEKTRLVLVGDYNQLPSVDAGCVMADLTDGKTDMYSISKKVKEVLGEDLFSDKNDPCFMPENFRAELRINHRAGNDDLKNAFIAVENEKNIGNSLKTTDLNGFIQANPGAYIIKPDKETLKAKSDIIYGVLDFAFGDEYKQKAKNISQKLDFENLIVESVYSDLDELFALVNRYKILCSKRRGFTGCNTVNRRFAEKYAGRRRETFAVGMPLMITRNNRKYDVYNGDIGIVLCDRNKNMRLVFCIKNQYRAYMLSDFEFYEYAFACTIHKSQGSEYENVLIPLDTVEKGDEFMSKQLLYTAITRAKNSFAVLGNLKDIETMCQNRLVRENAIDLL